MLEKFLYKETLFFIYSPFATSDFKGLCGILLPPFLSSPILSAPSYSAGNHFRALISHVTLL